MTSDANDDLPQLAAEIVLAYASRHEVAPADLPGLFTRFHQALADLGKEAPPAPEPALQPAVPIRASVKPDHLVCLEDGRKLKTLKRHLRARYGMTPADYREKWKLPPDYPMVAPAYAATRRAIARKTGFGQVPAASIAPAPVAAPKPATAPKQAVAEAVHSKPAVLNADKPESAPAAPKVVAAPKPPAALKQAVVEAVHSKPVAPTADKPEPTPAAPQVVAAPQAAPARRKLLKPLFARDADPVRAEGPAAAPAGEAAQGFEVALGLLRQAISRRRCVRTTYNKRVVTLAPHLVFTRHDELYLRAVTVEQDGRKPREWKLGTFKLAGLGPVSPSLTPFVYFTDYKAEAAQTANIVCALAQG